MDQYNLCLGCMEEKDAAQICPHCGYKEGAASESALHLQPGTILQNKYLLGRVLGQGGFGITYLAWDLNLNLKLAIKEYLPLDMASRVTGQATVSVYKKELAGNFQYGLEKYLEEARTLARFTGHPSIVWVRDFFKANGTAYIVMEYVEGASLKEYLRTIKEPLSFEQALTIFMPVLDALKEVHAEGILHRDISPDNILISSRGRVVLIDFGAARQAVGEQSRSLSVIMKAGFSPEEQYHSKGKQGPWTDIYAVAASIYCAITGTIPPESLSRLSEDMLVVPSQLGVKINPGLEKALLKAMAVRAKDRYQTAEEFQKKLLGGKPPKDNKTPKTEKTGEPLDEQEDSILCPYCSERIKSGAIKCKHCKTHLQEDLLETKEKPQKPLPGDEYSSKTGPKRTATELAVAAIIVIALGAIFYTGSWFFTGNDDGAVIEEDSLSVDQENEIESAPGEIPDFTLVQVGEPRSTYTFPTDIPGSMITTFNGQDDRTYTWRSTGDPKTAEVTGGYEIAENQVTYQLWYVVRKWAEENGYHFENRGREGSKGIDGAAPTTAKNEPVTNVNWRDTIVWLNALSEKKGLEPVYRTDGGEIIQDARDDNARVIDKVEQTDNNGYRLPTSQEWEMAARWEGDTPSTHNSIELGGKWWTHCWYASGAKAHTADATDAVAWYHDNSDTGQGRKTQPVGQKNANALGLYDMNGNVLDWTFTESGSYRVMRGGSWIDNRLSVKSIKSFSPCKGNIIFGFRIARTP